MSRKLRTIEMLAKGELAVCMHIKPRFNTGIKRNLSPISKSQGAQMSDVRYSQTRKGNKTSQK